jgi:hypothetical protein
MGLPAPVSQSVRQISLCDRSVLDWGELPASPSFWRLVWLFYVSFFDVISGFLIACGRLLGLF